MLSLCLGRLVFVGFASSLVACATAPPTYELTPSLGDVTWSAGRPVLQQVIDGVQVAVAPAEPASDNLGVHVQISNVGAARFDVSAKDVTFTACSGTVNASCAPTAVVVDPEVELARLDQRAHDERASANAKQGALAFLLVLNAVADVGAVASGHANRSTGSGTAATIDLMGGTAASADRTLDALQAEREFWANRALRRNTVDPGQTAEGTVFMSIYSQARFLWLHVRIGARQFSFRFAQTASAPG